MALTLLYILAGLFILLLVYYLGVFTGSVFGNPQETNTKQVPISVIVYAKNNVTELKSLLPVLLNQNYHEFELVLVNNASTDGTLQLIKEFALLHSNIRVVDVVNNEAFWGNKKYAVTLGVKACKYEYVVYIDADKKIFSDNFLLQFSSHFTLNKTLIIGSFYYKKDGSLFNKYFRFVHTMQQMQALAWSKISQPYSLASPQIAFKKQEFYKVNGFIAHIQKRSFMTEYFIGDAATAKNTTICEHNDAMVEAAAIEPTAFKNYRKEQEQLLSNLKNGTLIKVKSFNLLQILFFITAIASLIMMEYWHITLGILLLRSLILWVLVAKSAKKLRYNDIVFYFPIFDLFYIFSQVQLFFWKFNRKTNI